MVTIFITKTVNHKQFNELHNKRNNTTNNENALHIKKTFSKKHYITNVFRSNNDYTEHYICI